MAFQQALAHHQAERLVEAEAIYRKILAAQPAHFDSQHLLGVAHHQRGDHEQAVRHIDAALKLNSGSAAAHSNRGSALLQLKRFAEALASYDKAIAIKPDYADAFYNRGVLLGSLRRLEDAIASYDKAIALRPDYADAFDNRGTALAELNRRDDAMASFERAVALNPNHAGAFNNRGKLLADMNRLDDALASLDRALAIRPRYPEALGNRGTVLKALDRAQDALASYDQAIALRPDYAEAHYSRGVTLGYLQRHDEAAASYDLAADMHPGLKYVAGARLFARMQGCDWRDFGTASAQVVAAVAGGQTAAIPFAFLSIPASAEAQRMCAATYLADACPPSPAPMWRGERYAHDRIRVAYLSADLHDHAVAQLMAGVFEQHDRSRFETIALSLGPDREDAMRRRLRAAFSRLEDVRAKSDREIATFIRSHEIDILVDLGGLTLGGRAAILAQRPAPVQVNYLGYPGTLGRADWDYILADRFIIPESDRRHYAEQVACLPDSYMPADAGRRIAGQTPTRTQVGLPDAAFVFCCFNNSYKLTPDVFDFWMRLLKQVHSSVLWLSAASPSAMDRLRTEAVTRGVEPARLVFAERVASNEDHLARLRLADLFLDTLYYNAHTTACDALWAGLPLVTCAGATFASRVAGSLLTAVGLPELITHASADYEALALALARDPARLAAIRQKLATNRDTQPLFDTKRFTRHIEAAYATMWQRAQHGAAPASFVVPAHAPPR